jgi:hypothetical protein
MTSVLPSEFYGSTKQSAPKWHNICGPGTRRRRPRGLQKRGNEGLCYIS